MKASGTTVSCEFCNTATYRSSVLHINLKILHSIWMAVKAIYDVLYYLAASCHTVMRFTVLHESVECCAILYCTVLYYTVLCYIVLLHTMIYCSVLCFVMLHVLCCVL